MNEFQVPTDLGRIPGKIYCGEETKSLDEIHKKIVDVVTLIEKKYGRNVITPNLHLSLHLNACSHDFGPLYAFWCFSFERMNGILVYVELSSLQNEPSSAHNEPESSETSKKSVDISSLKEKYNIRLPRLYKEQTSAPQTVHFSEELESTIPETVDELKTEEIAELKRQNSQMEIDFEEKLEKSQENINQMKEEIDFLANINQQFDAENDQLIKNLNRFRKYRIPESISVRSSPGDSGTESEIIPSKCLKGRKLKSKKIAKTNKEKRVFGNDSEEEDTESDDEKNEKSARNEMKTIIKTIDSEFKLQKSLAPKFRPSVTQLTKWLNSIHKSRRATAQMRNSGKLPKDLRRVHANNRQNDKKIRRIKAAKELFRKNDPNITDYDKESLLRMLADRAFYSPEMSDTDEEDRSKTVVNVYDLSWRSAKLKHLLRNVLDPKSASTKAPNWACNEQEDVIYDTEFVQTEGEDEPSFASTSSSKISAEQ
ncbi:hypothetical protein Glove_334g23 [Diversispora epigaea]|uniref:Uncharacterized protein n=1 Tax=Diversispora epigaea TaxID=1348612 RepID=A0A397HIT9_9GLOM|nr:hypothetical protein Glove_334g23 [Diversispora epigaea]